MRIPSVSFAVARSRSLRILQRPLAPGGLKVAGSGAVETLSGASDGLLSTRRFVRLPVNFVFPCLGCLLTLLLPRGTHAMFLLFKSVLGGTQSCTPLVVKRLMKGDNHVGRGSRQRGFNRSKYCNEFEVSQYGRTMAISKFRDSLKAENALRTDLWTLSGLRLICHCKAHEKGHGDTVIEEFELVTSKFRSRLQRVFHLRL